MLRTNRNGKLNTRWTIAALRGLAALAIIVCCASAEADTIFSNFGSVNPYIYVGWTFGRDAPATAIAKSFVPASDYQVDSIEVYAIHGIADPGPNRLRLYLAQGDITPGAEIESYSFVNLPDCCNWGSIVSVTTATSALHSLLRGGSKYWVVLTTEPDTHMGWLANGSGSLGEVGWQDTMGWGLGSSVEAPALAVYGTPAAVPEPATMLLLGSGLVGLAGYGRKKFLKK